ncbi:MAG: glycoside hydrolase family 30 protein [Clostridiales bacterium]|nr:glycoside hydrolase family 30 protein [Clostridiales bacterium]
MKIIKAQTSFGGEYMKPLAAPEFAPDGKTELQVVNIYPVKNQTWLGFGGAFTESSAYCYNLLSDDKKAEMIREYFSQDGLGYDFCRTHIGSCDFSLAEYAYTEPNDRTLETFDLGQDRKYVLPFIVDAVKASPEMILFASPWSSPAWMKTNGKSNYGGKIADEWKGVWAEYVVKYIKAYEAEGIKISAVTVQNEPIAVQSWESCQYSAADEAEMIRDYLAPAFDRAGLDTKIIIWDHNKERLYERACDTLSDKAVCDRVWGIGFHWYSGRHFDGVRLTYDTFPDKPLIETEFCRGLPVTDWTAKDYVIEILCNMNNGMSASVDWNMILDENGGPYHWRKGGCSSAIVVDSKTGEILKTPVYYAIAHFAKYIPRGSVRLTTSSYDDDVLATAFERPDGNIAVVMFNRSSNSKTVMLRIPVGENAETAKFELSAGEIVSLILA